MLFGLGGQHRYDLMALILKFSICFFGERVGLQFWSFQKFLGGFKRFPGYFFHLGTFQKPKRTDDEGSWGISGIFLKWLDLGGIHWDGWIGYWGVSLNLWPFFCPIFLQAVLSPEDPTVPPFCRNSGSLAGKKTSPLCIYICYINNIYTYICILTYGPFLLLFDCLVRKWRKGHAEQLELQRYYIVCNTYMYIVRMYIYIVHGCGKIRWCGIRQHQSNFFNDSWTFISKPPTTNMKNQLHICCFFNICIPSW